MSIYNDPRYFQRFRADMNDAVKGQGFKGGQDLNQAFEYFQQQDNINQLKNMSFVSKQNNQIEFKVQDISNGFKSFGFTDESVQVEAFLKGISKKNPQTGEITFTANDIINYQKIIQKKNYMQDKDFIRIFFKSLTKNGVEDKVTIDDMKTVIRQLKMKDEIAAPEEYVERTAGAHNSKWFTQKQLLDVVLSNQVQQKEPAQAQGFQIQVQQQQQQIIEEDKQDFVQKKKGNRQLVAA